MDVVVPSICLSSVAGALLFYVGGRLSPRPAPPPPPPPALERDLSGVHEARDRAEAAFAREREQTEALRAELSNAHQARAQADAEAAASLRRLADEGTRLRRSAAELTEQLAALRTRATAESEARTRPGLDAAEARAAAAEIRTAELDAELSKTRAELEKAAATARRLSNEATALRARAATASRAATDLEAARAAVAEAEASAVARARLQEENQRLAQTVATLQASLETVRETARDRDRTPAPDLAEVQRKGLEAAMKLRTLEMRAAEIDRREAEDADLRRQVDALKGAEAEAAELRLRVRDLEAHGFARRTRTLTGIEQGPDDMPVSTGAPELSATLELGLRQLCKREQGCRAAVLADYRGLLIAAYGEASHRDELAAGASILTSAAERLRELLPLGEAASFTLLDEHDIVFRARLLSWGDERFLLATLGAAPPTGDPAAEAMRARIAAMIGAG